MYDSDTLQATENTRAHTRIYMLCSRPMQQVQTEISGHTDNTGSDQHNYRLSENRAFEVYKYLFLNHIQKERMEYKGYGKDRPLRTNDTEEGRKENRRTEIRVR